MAKFDVVVVGGGLGGLQCAYALSKEGLNVCLLDKNPRIGGMIQSIARNGVLFNTGLNYTESLGEGEILNKYFTYLDIMDKVEFKQLDTQCFEKISFIEDNTEYEFAQSYPDFIDTLAKKFPEERANIEKYVDELNNVCNSFPYYNLDDEAIDIDLMESYTKMNTYEFIKSITSNTKLQSVLAGTNILHAGDKKTTPLYIHALINYSFIRSAWRVIGGGSKIAVTLAKGIIAKGGTIKKNKEVIKFIVKDKKVIAVECSDGEKIEADTFISNIHPSRTLDLIDKGDIRKAYRNRISSIDNSIGMFSIYIVLKKNKLKYQNYNNHLFANDNVWNTEYTNWPENCLYYTQQKNSKAEYANGITAITYMKYSEVEKWENTTVENRGEDYKQFKKEKAEKLIDFISSKIPDIRDYIDTYYTSTPLTYRDYTASVNGSAYGAIKDYSFPLKSIIQPQSKIPNLLFTGQNLNVHGILGVTIGSILTCSAILGDEYMLDKIMNKEKKQ